MGKGYKIKRKTLALCICFVVLIMNCIPVMAAEEDVAKPLRAEMCGNCWRGNLIPGLRYVTTDSKTVSCPHYTNAGWSDLVILTITHQEYTCDYCGYSYTATGVQESSPICGKP